MKFFSKYKKQILSVFLCVALFSCFIGFSFSSSAANITETYPISNFSVFAVNKSPNYSTSFTKDGDIFVLGPVPSLDSVQPYWSYFAISIKDFFDPPNVEGRSVLLSLSLDLIVEKDSSINLALQNGYDILSAAAFRNCNLQINNGILISPEQYIVRDSDGVLRDPLDSSFWSQYAGTNQYDLSIDILFDISDYIGVDFVNAYIFFPRIDQAPTLSLWASPYEDTYRFRVDNFNYTYVYKPFSDIVQDDLSDIKGSLGLVNNKLDSISSSVNQKFDQTNETLGSIDQGIQDILKPSTPSVDFKNQWNDYFANNPMPDISNLPLYDMSNLMTLLADSSQVIRGIFSPFFLRDYQVTVPLINGFSNIKLDPVATYVSLSFALSLSILIIGILKGSRG